MTSNVAPNVDRHLLSLVLLHLNMTDIDPDHEDTMFVSSVTTRDGMALVTYTTIITIDPDAGYADVVTVRTTTLPSTTSVINIEHHTFDATEQRFQ